VRFRAGVRASLTVCVSAFLPSLLQSRRPEPRLRTPAQDKRITVLKLFHESAEPWLLKDMEKAAAKKGVVFQAVKEVVQSLVDDSLVHMDKVGTSNWFWSFPGAADAAVRARLEAVEREATRVDAESRDIAQRLQTAQAECPETEDRVSARDALERAEATHASLKAEEATFASGDDAMMAAMREGTPMAKEAANRWTDNVFVLKSWVEKKTSSRDETRAFFKAQAEIDFDTFDYVE
jgi:hypothetical protein